jgi:hypothetical protein
MPAMMPSTRLRFSSIALGRITPSLYVRYTATSWLTTLLFEAAITLVINGVIVPRDDAQNSIFLLQTFSQRAAIWT